MTTALDQYIQKKNQTSGVALRAKEYLLADNDDSAIAELSELIRLEPNSGMGLLHARAYLSSQGTPPLSPLQLAHALDRAHVDLLKARSIAPVTEINHACGYLAACQIPPE